MSAQRLQKPTAKSKSRRPRQNSQKKAVTGAAVSPALSEIASKQRRQLHRQWPWGWQLQPHEPARKFPKLPSIWKLSVQTARTLWEQKLLLGGVIGVYVGLNLLLVQSFASSTQVTNLKTHLGQFFHGHPSQLLDSGSAFTQLLGSSSPNSNQSGGVYEFFLLVMSSLAVVWVLRQVQAGGWPRIRDAYYKGLYPLVPFMLVLLVFGLDLIPMMIGSALYGLVVSGGIAVFWYEQALWGLVAVAGIALSLYLAVSAIFALYVTTLPDMTPMGALRSARPLVRGRRWRIVGRVLYLPVALLVIGFVIMAPVAIMFEPIARAVLFILAALAIAAVHTYMYTLYRELLREPD